MQISIIIGVILMIIGGEAVTSGEYSQTDFLGILSDKPWILTGATAGLILLFGLSIISVNKMVAIAVRKGKRIRKTAKIISLWRISAVTLAGVISFFLGWGNIAEYITSIYIFKMVLWLVPFAALIFIQLYFCYDLDIYSRKGYLPGEYEGDYGVWPKSSYMNYHLRHNLLGIIIPILVITLMTDIGEYVYRYISDNFQSVQEIPFIEEILAIAAIGLAYLLAPLVLRYVWMTKPMPISQQREKLEGFCRMMKLRYSDILIWKTYRMVGNAAVTGLIPMIRYVIVSDKLLDNLSDEQLCAVFGHEAGHIHHKHMPLLLMAIIGIISVFGIAVESIIDLLPIDWPAWIVQLITFALGAASFGGGFVVFGYVSRNFEREADVYGATAADEFNHGADGRLTSIGSAVMSSALQRLAFINGISVSTRSWRHSSLSSRMELLFDLAVTAGHLAHFRRRLRLIKASVIIVFILSIALLF